MNMDPAWRRARGAAFPKDDEFGLAGVVTTASARGPRPQTVSDTPVDPTFNSPRRRAVNPNLTGAAAWPRTDALRPTTSELKGPGQVGRFLTKLMPAEPTGSRSPSRSPRVQRLQSPLDSTFDPQRAAVESAVRFQEKYPPLPPAATMPDGQSTARAADLGSSEGGTGGSTLARAAPLAPLDVPPTRAGTAVDSPITPKRRQRSRNGGGGAVEAQLIVEPSHATTFEVDLSSPSSGPGAPNMRSESDRAAAEAHAAAMTSSEKEEAMAVGREVAMAATLAGSAPAEAATRAAEAAARVEKAYAAGRDALARSEAAGEDAAAGLAAEAATIAAVRDGATQEAADAAAEAAKAAVKAVVESSASGRHADMSGGGAVMAMAQTAAAAASACYAKVVASGVALSEATAGAAVAGLAALAVVQDCGAGHVAMAAAEAVSRACKDASDPRIHAAARWSAAQLTSRRPADSIRGELGELVGVQGTASLAEVERMAEAGGAEAGHYFGGQQQPKEGKRQTDVGNEAIAIAAAAGYGGDDFAKEAARLASLTALSANKASPEEAVAAGQAAASAASGGAGPVDCAIAGRAALAAFREVEASGADAEQTLQAAQMAGRIAAEQSKRGMLPHSAIEGGKAGAAISIALDASAPSTSGTSTKAREAAVKAGAEAAAVAASSNAGGSLNICTKAAAAAAAAASLEGKPAVAIEAAGEAAAKAVAASESRSRLTKQSVDGASEEEGADDVGGGGQDNLRMERMEVGVVRVDAQDEKQLDSHVGNGVGDGDDPTRDNRTQRTSRTSADAPLASAFGVDHALAMKVAMAAGSKAAAKTTELLNAARGAVIASGVPPEMAMAKAAIAAKLATRLRATPSQAVALSIGSSVAEASAAVAAAQLADKIEAADASHAGRSTSEMTIPHEHVIAAAMVAADAVSQGARLEEAASNGAEAAASVCNGSSLNTVVRAPRGEP